VPQGSPGFSAYLRGACEYQGEEGLQSIVRRAYGVTWGLRPKVVYWLCVCIFQPSVSFASLVWWPGCQMPSAKTRLSRIQKLACLVIKGTMLITAAGAMDAFAFLHVM
jgi:hypothetical protein